MGLMIKHKEYDIYGIYDDSIDHFVFRLDFHTYEIAVKIVEWLEENIDYWNGDTRNYIEEYNKEMEQPGGYCWLIPFYVVFFNEDDYFKFKMVWE